MMRQRKSLNPDRISAAMNRFFPGKTSSSSSVAKAVVVHEIKPQEERDPACFDWEEIDRYNCFLDYEGEIYDHGWALFYRDNILALIQRIEADNSFDYQENGFDNKGFSAYIFDQNVACICATTDRGLLGSTLPEAQDWCERTIDEMEQKGIINLSSQRR